MLAIVIVMLLRVLLCNLSPLFYGEEVWDLDFNSNGFYYGLRKVGLIVHNGLDL